uniref:Uncharacterized protein n=1 Tax=Knipowitschia caucasica TaxID=637954 RepID=A0AAV2MB20_KNICA
MDGLSTHSPGPLALWPSGSDCGRSICLLLFCSVGTRLGPTMEDPPCPFFHPQAAAGSLGECCAARRITLRAASVSSESNSRFEANKGKRDSEHKTSTNRISPSLSITLRSHMKTVEQESSRPLTGEAAADKVEE